MTPAHPHTTDFYLCKEIAMIKFSLKGSTVSWNKNANVTNISVLCIVDWELNDFSISFFFSRTQFFFWDLKYNSEISKIFLRTQLFFWTHFSPWPCWLHFCDSTLVDWHPRVLLMFEKHFISLNWAIYGAASLIKSLINVWKHIISSLKNFWSFLKVKLPNSA